MAAVVAPLAILYGLVVHSYVQALFLRSGCVYGRSVGQTCPPPTSRSLGCLSPALTADHFSLPPRPVHSTRSCPNALCLRSTLSFAIVHNLTSHSSILPHYSSPTKRPTTTRPMLGRSSGDAGARLRRSKSASAVTRHHAHAPEPLDPHVAQHHALAAATTAFVRAHGISASEKVNKRSSELSRTKSTSSRKSLTSQGSHFPPRESSNQPRDGQIPITQRQSRPTAINTEKFPPFYPTPGSDRPLSTQPSITFNENTRPCSQSRSHQQSATSSITSQQIRKARSMYYASSIQTGSPIARPPAQYLTTPPAASIRPAPDVLRVRNTAPSPLVPPKLPVTVAPGNTIDDARDKYLQTFQQQQRPIKHKPSLFLAPFKKRQERAKKKERPVSAGVLSAPSSSRHTPHDVSRESLDDFGFPIIKKEKRSFSNSIKDKFKKVFRRTSNNATIMPVQQIEASRDYFNNQVPSNEVTTRHDTPDIPSPDHKTLLRVKSRASSFERAPSPILRPSSRSSNRSRGSNRR